MVKIISKYRLNSWFCIILVYRFLYFLPFEHFFILQSNIYRFSCYTRLVLRQSSLSNILFVDFKSKMFPIYSPWYSRKLASSAKILSYTPTFPQQCLLLCKFVPSVKESTHVLKDRFQRRRPPWFPLLSNGVGKCEEIITRKEKRSVQDGNVIGGSSQSKRLERNKMK